MIHTVEPYVIDHDGPLVEGLLERPKLEEVQKPLDPDPRIAKEG